jgi:hypothetical protein
MLLTIKRVEGPWFTIGFLNVDDRFFCYTLEDKVRPPGEKVPGQTAIPYGRYRVELTPSTRFKRVMPLLLSVPNFTGVRIHAGNTTEDTEGCILVGDELDSTDPVKGPVLKAGTSRPAFDRLFVALDLAREQGDTIWCDIVPASKEA